MKDFLGNELMVGDKIVVSRGNVFDEELLELGEIVRCQTNIWDQVIIVYKDDFNQETWVKEHSVMKL